MQIAKLLGHDHNCLLLVQEYFAFERVHSTPAAFAALCRKG
jgi:hypothetical protein